VTCKVLFITPSAALASAVTHGLQERGFVVTINDTLAGLYHLVTRAEPDVLLLDGDLPRLALEASSKFLMQKGMSRNLPIVLYTTPRPHEDPALLTQLVLADDFVEKGVDLKPLVRTLVKLAPDATKFIRMPTAEPTRAPARSSEGKPMVLVVDDDPPIARLLKKILEQKYTVVAVDNGADALTECKRTSFAAVFCDLKMPNISGADVYRAIAAFDPFMADRVVFVTAHQLDAHETEFFIGLKNHVVHKPFSMREILAVAEQLIRD
jgi:DNA-binding response OmpR family regulator